MFGRILVAAIGAFITALLPLHAATTSSGMQQQSLNGDNVRATLAIPTESIPRFGFIPVRVTVENRQARDLRWQVEAALTSYSNMNGQSVGTATFALHAPASRNSEHWIYVPSSDPGTDGSRGGYVGRWGHLAITISGTAFSDRSVMFNPTAAGNQMVPWAVSTNVENAVRTHLVGLKTTGPNPYAPPAYSHGRRIATAGPRPLLSRAPQLFVFDPAQPFADWRMWSPFAQVILRADEYTTLPPGTRAALRSWVALGGSLHLVPETAAHGSEQRFGAGRIVTHARPISATGAHDSAGLFTAENIFTPTLAIPADLSLQQSSLAKLVPAAKRAGDWLVYFFVGFAVLVAPVNLFAIAPIKRRHWLFLTVPAISTAAVAILATAIYLQDGVGGEGVRRAVVALLPGDNQAAIFQEQVSRTGLLFGTSFPAADDMIAAAVPVEDAQGGRALEYRRQEGRGGGDWFRGRARQAQHLRRLVPTRARVEQVGTAPDGAPIVQSSVGTTLSEFCIETPTGWWGAKRLAPGARVPLERVTVPSEFAPRATGFSRTVSGHLGNIISALHGGASSGAADRFIALAEPSDLAPIATLESIRWKDSLVLLTGVLEPALGAGRATP